MGRNAGKPPTAAKKRLAGEQERFAHRPPVVNTFYEVREGQSSKAPRRALSAPSSSSRGTEQRRTGQGFGIHELNPRVKKELRSLSEDEGLEALVHLVLIEAVAHEDPPDCVRQFIGTVLADLEREDVVYPVRAQNPEKCLGMLQQKESSAGKGSSLLALLRFLLSQGKKLVRDSDAALQRQKRDRFESSISALCFQLDPKYICQLPEPRSFRGRGTDVAETHCLLLRLHNAASHVSNLQRIAICVCEDPDNTNSSILRGLRHEVSHAFDRLEQKGVKVVYANSWNILRAEGNFDVVYVVGHTDRQGRAGEPVLNLDGRSKTSLVAAKALCGTGKPPQLVVVNGCRSLVHAAPLLDCGVGHVICWETPVRDSEAVIFGEALIDELVKTKKVEVVKAFQKAHSKATEEGSTAWALAPGHTSPKSTTANLRIKRELSDASLHAHSLPRPTQIKRELSSQSNLHSREASTPKAMKKERSTGSASQPKKRNLKRRLTDANIHSLSSLASSEKRRRKLCKQPAERAHSNTFNDEAIARAMQESSQPSSQEQGESPSDFAIAHALQAEEAGAEGCIVM